MITPEYNFGMPATLANAIDFLYKEWNYKHVSFVSYGGLSGGTRSVQMCKEVMTTVKLVPVYEAVNLPFFEKKIDEKEQFHSDELIDNAVHNMVNELLKWTRVLKPMRG